MSCSSTAPSLRSACVASLLTPRRAHRRDVRADDLPAEIGAAYPRLALTTDRVLAAHLELEVHGGQVTAERDDFEPDPILFDTRPGRPPHAVGGAPRGPVAVRLQRVADGVRAVPERRVQHLDVVVDQRLLVALEQRAHLRHDLGDVGGRVQAYGSTCVVVLPFAVKAM